MLEGLIFVAGFFLLIFSVIFILVLTVQSVSGTMNLSNGFRDMIIRIADRFGVYRGEVIVK